MEEEGGATSKKGAEERISKEGISSSERREE